MKNSPRYPKPSAMGGTLIRKVLAQFKAHEFALPLSKPTLIATSGGVDSMALAHLVSRYGRKIVDPSLITLLHFDHQWRKESATVEKNAVKKMAKNLGVTFRSIQLEKAKKGVNLEKDARSKRLTAFARLAGEGLAFGHVLTAHHQDDVVETLVWRFLRGELSEFLQGILFNNDSVLRPFLKVSKKDLYAYADEEKIPFFEDPTNASGEGMRSFLRKELIPLLETRFPGVRASIAGYADRLQGKSKPPASASLPISVMQVVEIAIGQSLKRAQRAQLEVFCQDIGRPGMIGKQISLPHGMILEVQKEGLLLKTSHRP